MLGEATLMQCASIHVYPNSAKAIHFSALGRAKSPLSSTLRVCSLPLSCRFRSVDPKVKVESKATSVTDCGRPRRTNAVHSVPFNSTERILFLHVGQDLHANPVKCSVAYM